MTAKDFAAKRILRGQVLHVGDGDNFRFFHKPLYYRLFHPTAAFRSTKDQKLSDHSIHIRLAGVDAPECAHFGMPGQEYGPIAKEWLTNYIKNRTVDVQVFQRDQYSRIVADVWVYRPVENIILRFLCGTLLLGYLSWYWKNVSAQMLKAGMAVVYEGAGEVYGHAFHKKALMKLEANAKRKRIGMWSSNNVQSPRQYKAQYKKQ